MALLNPYLGLAQFKATLRDQVTAHDEEYERALNGAFDQIDDYCGRFFYRTEEASAKVLRADDPYTLLIPDIPDAENLIVKTDDDNDGVFETTWDPSDYEAVEDIRFEGKRPIVKIIAVGSRSFPVSRPRVPGQRPRRAGVQLTSPWGWPAIPRAVVTASQIVAQDHFRSKDLSGIAAQYGTGTRFTRDITASAYGQRAGYSRILIPPLNVEAEQLIAPLRIHVVA